jgi:hypothetical protein
MTEISSDANWRTWCTSGGVGCHQSMGRGTLTWKPVDEVDGNIGNNTSDPVRIYGIGQVGSVTRTYSVELSGATEEPMDVLNTVAHTGKNLVMNSGASITLNGGPLSAGANVQNNGTINGAVEGPNTPSPYGTISGGYTSKAAKTLPETDSDVYATYSGQATTISYSSIPSATIQNCVISAGNNPYGGGTNSNGIYLITIPSASGLTIKNCRIKGTLVIYMGASSFILMQNEVLWEASGNAPILITKAGGTATSVTFCSTGNSLSETTLATNFNPSHTPYNGASDSANDDSYSAQLVGLIHLTTGAQATHVTNANISNMTGGFKLNGTIITCGMLTISGLNHSLTLNETLVDNPPSGYSSSSGGSGEIAPTAGSWRWDSAP